MRSNVALLLSAGLVSLACACASEPAPRAKAAATEQIQCSPDPTADEQRELQLIRATIVVKSQPLYSLVPTRDVQPEARVNGATLVVQPPPGVTPERMTRTLQCHAARAALGQVDRSVLPDDPFVLSGSWLDINVMPLEQGQDAVMITANDIPHGLVVLQNANAFAVSRGGSIDSTCVPWRKANSLENGCPERPPLLH